MDGNIRDRRPGFCRGFTAVGKTLSDVRQCATLVRLCAHGKRRVQGLELKPWIVDPAHAALPLELPVLSGLRRALPPARPGRVRAIRGGR